MMLTMLAESALRSLLLGSVVWIGLNLFRVRNPHVHMTSWIMVLVASLSMPLLMHWTTVSITVDALPVQAPEALWPATNPLAGPLTESPPLDSGTSVAARGESHQTINWLTVASAIYACVAGVLLLRLLVGLYLTWRLVRAARPMGEPWTADYSVRVSNVIAGPVTFGSTILLPPQCSDWDLSKRRAVLAHEGAHVANRDFYVLLLASLNRAVFWFSPFAWWHLVRLAELAEIISDARALEVLDDRLSYAEILLDLVQRARQAPAGFELGLEMARACTVRSRVERILAATMAPARLGWRKRIWTTAVILPLVVVSAGSIAYRAAPLSTPAFDGATDTPTASQGPRQVAFYSFGDRSIFTVFHQGDDLFGQVSGQRKLRLAASGDGTYSYPAAAGPITFATVNDPQRSEVVSSQNGRDVRGARIAEMSWPGVEADAQQLDSYVGWYHLAPGRVLTVSRDGDRLSLQETGRQKLEVTASGADAFSDDRDNIVVFLRYGQTKITQALLQEPAAGARLAPRIGAARAKAIEEQFARRLAEVPDRFRDQAPLPGSREAILRGIEDLRRGTPNYDRMSATLASKIRRQVGELQSMFNAFGAVESIFFRGVGPGGYDFYGVKFANGFAEFRLLLGADGRVDDVIFRADGNDARGGIAACTEEQGLKARDGAAPIHLLIYNATGSGIQLHKLDTEGKRMAQGVIGANTSLSVLTSVESPWVVTDASGKCLEIMLPGQQTRYHTVEGVDAAGRPARAMSQRTTPLAGSEETLRQYIEALRRGEPDYDRMTAEVAAQTRQQLPFNQAILSRLGALRAMSFRGVTTMGSDIYMANFANGSAEWRIGLVEGGAIGRIALGPQ
jgi:beta-lactamase regulating signal transducer with metallopeptidase domain